MKPTCYVGNAAFMIGKIMTSQSSSGVYYLADYPQSSVQDWANLIYKASGSTKELRSAPAFLLNLIALVGDVLRLIGIGSLYTARLKNMTVSRSIRYKIRKHCRRLAVHSESWRRKDYRMVSQCRVAMVCENLDPSFVGKQLQFELVNALREEGSLVTVFAGTNFKNGPIIPHANASEQFYYLSEKFKVSMDLMVKLYRQTNTIWFTATISGIWFHLRSDFLLLVTKRVCQFFRAWQWER